MKKFITLLLLIPIIGFSQSFGNFKIDKFKDGEENLRETNEWYKTAGGAFIKYYNKTPIGIKNAVSNIESILLSNNMKIEEPSLDNSYLSSLVKNIYDYEMLNISISNESSEVYKSWDIDRKSFLLLSLKKDSYSVMILYLK